MLGVERTLNHLRLVVFGMIVALTILPGSLLLTAARPATAAWDWHDIELAAPTLAWDWHDIELAAPPVAWDWHDIEGATVAWDWHDIEGANAA